MVLNLTLLSRGMFIYVEADFLVLNSI